MSNSLCIYTTANDSYVPMAAASLLTVRKHNKSIPLYIIGTKFSKKSKMFCNKYNIQLIEVNYTDIFYKSWDYPVECYYIFAGPQLFYERGFSHAMYMDGDIYCNKNPEIDLSRVKMFAGISVAKVSEIFGKDLNVILNNFKIVNKNQDRMNNGVVYYNTKALTEIDYLSVIADLFDKCVKLDIPRKGDDSLSSLFQYTHPNYDYLFLPRTYNFYPTHKVPYKDKDRWYQEDKYLLKECVFYHFGASSPKPWTLGAKFPNRTTEIFTNRWRRSMLKNFERDDARMFFPEIYNKTFSVRAKRKFKQILLGWATS